MFLTVLGELVWPTSEPAWTLSLLFVMKGLGIEEQTARQVIARGAAAGWIESERHGREVRWTITPTGREIFERGSRRVTSMSDPFTDWDGNWLTLLVTIPHSHRTARKRLYAGLTWAGFGNPAPGVWVSPHPERSGEVDALIDELELRGHAMSFVGRAGAVGLSEREIVSKGWDLDAIAAHYAAVLEAFSGPTPPPGDEMLFAHIRLVSEWQRLPFSDPQLPEALVPGWIGRRVATHIERLRDEWSAAVHDRWAEINVGA